jgi:molybdenum cofactor biosynthesis enzyme MoaA
MKANNLTISIDAPCNLDCPFCISKMTFAPKPDAELFWRNLRKAELISRAAGISSVMITSKGEPILNMPYVIKVLEVFLNFPTEIQTNGSLLTDDIIKDLAEMKLNTIAVSVSGALADYEAIFYRIMRFNVNARATIVLTDNILNIDLSYVIRFCHNHGIRQLTFRKATAPMRVISNDKSHNTLDWIKNNTFEKFEPLFRELRAYQNEKNVIRKLPWGAIVHDVEGIAVTTIDYCIQDHNNWYDIRSLIYHQDGHLYTSWDKPSSIIF